MNDLKFRAFDKKQNKWLFGYDMPNLGGFSLLGEVVLMGELSSIPLGRLFDDIEITASIGIKDKNNRLLYQKDFIKYVSENDGETEFISEVGASMFGGISVLDAGLNMEFVLYGYGLREGNFEVIGNVFENPEIVNI